MNTDETRPAPISAAQEYMGMLAAIFGAMEVLHSPGLLQDKDRPRLCAAELLRQCIRIAALNSAVTSTANKR